MSLWLLRCVACMWRPEVTWGWLGLTLVILMALALRLVSSGHALMSQVECFSWRIATDSRCVLLRDLRTDTHPPLYYGLLRGWCQSLSTKAFAVRALSV